MLKKFVDFFIFFVTVMILGLFVDIDIIVPFSLGAAMATGLFSLLLWQKITLEKIIPVAVFLFIASVMTFLGGAAYNNDWFHYQGYGCLMAALISFCIVFMELHPELKQNPALLGGMKSYPKLKRAERIN